MFLEAMFVQGQVAQGQARQRSLSSPPSPCRWRSPAAGFGVETGYDFYVQVKLQQAADAAAFGGGVGKSGRGSSSGQPSSAPRRPGPAERLHRAASGHDPGHDGAGRQLRPGGPDPKASRAIFSGDFSSVRRLDDRRQRRRLLRQHGQRLHPGAGPILSSEASFSGSSTPHPQTAAW